MRPNRIIGREKKAKGASRPNLIYSKKPIMPLYQGIRMNFNSIEVKQGEFVPSHSSRKCMKKQDKSIMAGNARRNKTKSWRWEMCEEEIRQNQKWQETCEEEIR